jgi:hypothetical protein
VSSSAADSELAVMADSLDPGCSALVVIWENTWAARLAAAVRGSGGELFAQYRIPHEVVASALDALREDLEDLEDELDEEDLADDETTEGAGPGRVGGVGPGPRQRT